MSIYKVQILQKKEDFFDEIFDFLKQKSTIFKREFSLNNILNNNVSNMDFFKKNSPVTVDQVYGSTFQSQYRTNDQIYAISHNVISIGYDSDGYFAYIEPTSYGDVIDFNKTILKPVYFKNQDDIWVIATFDVDFDIINSAA